LREERRLREFENRALRKILGHKRDEELYEIYSSPNIRVIKSEE